LPEDGAPAHNATVVRNYLNGNFENCWIGTYGIIQWPPQSPDLIPLDYFLCGYLKTVVYADSPTRLMHLKDKINAVCIHYNQLTEEQISIATN
jgi:hypothetical protein